MRKGYKNEEIKNLEFDSSNQFPIIAITNDLKILDCSFYLLFYKSVQIILIHAIITV